MGQASGVVGDFLGELGRALERVPPEPIERALDVLLGAWAAGRRVYLIGNGGSAATASHLACDLTKTAHLPGRPALRAFALVDSAPLVTAWGNDVAYEQVFGGQIAALVEPGDVVIAISASGRSPNILAGLAAAAAHGARTIGLLGFDGGPALGLVQVAIHIPSHDYGVVESAHLAIGQALAAALRRTLETQAPAAGRPGAAPARDGRSDGVA